jgi:hypothetical protein
VMLEFVPCMYTLEKNMVLRMMMVITVRIRKVMQDRDVFL